MKILLLFLVFASSLSAEELDHGFTFNNSTAQWRTFVRSDQKQRTLWGIDKASKSKLFQVKVVESDESFDETCKKLKSFSQKSGQVITSVIVLKTECLISIRDGSSKSVVLLSKLNRRFQSYIFLRTFDKDRRTASSESMPNSNHDSALLPELIHDAHTIQSSIQPHSI